MNPPRVTVWITTQFAALHHWPKAPDAVKFLRTPHRHLFKIRVGFRVMHNDRDVEFFIAKRLVEAYVREQFDNTTTTYSCEQFAMDILGHFDMMNCCSVEVSEDGENGALIERTDI
jgi:hypothetical protein